MQRFVMPANGILRTTVFSFALLIILSLFTTRNFTGGSLYAQDEPIAVTTVIKKSSSVFVNEESIELITVIDSEDNLINKAMITASVSDPAIAAIDIFDFNVGNDAVTVEGSLVVAETGENGQKAFLVKGLSGGSTDITFEVANGTVTTTEILTVNVIDLVAQIEVDKRIGIAPLTTQLFDRSLGKVDTRTWTFGDGGTSTTKNPAHTYTDSGIFDITLHLSQTTSFGAVTATATATVCVLPKESPGLPGVIFGTVFNPASNIPINNASVVLLTSTGESTFKTGKDGVYRFEDVSPGTIIISACKPPLFKCSVTDEITYTGDALIQSFELTSRLPPRQTEP